MPRLKTKKQPKPLLSRLMRAENAFRIAYQEHTAWGQKMVLARTELLEANAEERAKLALQYPEDPLIAAQAKIATDEMLKWYKKIGVVRPTRDECANCGAKFNETQRYSGVSFCLPCEESIDGPDIRTVTSDA